MDNPPPYNVEYEKGQGGGQYPPPAQAPPSGAYPPGPAGPPPSYPQAQYPQGPPPPNQAQYPPPGQAAYPQAQYPQGPPPQQGYGQQYPPPPGQPVVTQPVTTTNVIITSGTGGFGRNPVNMTCPHCQAQIVTTTETSPGSTAWLVVLIVTIVACVVFPFALLGCCFIPLCIPELRDVEHFCPNCRKSVGKYKRNL